MAARTLAVSALTLALAAAALPARAEFCYLDSDRDGNPIVYELGGAQCAGGNRLIFTRRYGPDRVSENHETYLTDSWPGFMGADQKCADGAKGARWMTDCPGSIIVGKTVMSGPQIWAYPKGSCSTFRSRFSSKRSELIAKDGKDNATSEKVLEAIGAGDSSMSELLAKIIDLGQNPPAKACYDK